MKNFEITRNLYNEINRWKESLKNDICGKPYIDLNTLDNMPKNVESWWKTDHIKTTPNKGMNHRLIALISYLNGEYVFTIKKQKKFVVRNKGFSDGGELFSDPYCYVEACGDQTYMVLGIENATYFDSEFDACQYKNAHQEVVKVEV